jgi:tRNA threonylcarbamoyladenosine biosynthesis protein TsaB
VILGLDTSTEWVNIALADKKSAWSKRVLTSPANTASKVLLPTVDELLQDADAARSGISGVVACVGPGGFTSLRVGIATAEGFGVAGLPTWGFSSFELRALSLSAQGLRGDTYVVLDGKRQEAFFQFWDLGKIQPLESAAKILLTDIDSAIGGHAWWAPERFLPQVAHHIGRPPITLEDEGEATLRALTELCRICPTRPEENPLAPFYLRETDAEINFPEASAHLNDAHKLGVPR